MSEAGRQAGSWMLVFEVADGVRPGAGVAVYSVFCFDVLALAGRGMVRASCQADGTVLLQK